MYGAPCGSLRSLLASAWQAAASYPSGPRQPVQARQVSSRHLWKILRRVALQLRRRSRRYSRAFGPQVCSLTARSTTHSPAVPPSRCAGARAAQWGRRSRAPTSGSAGSWGRSCASAGRPPQRAAASPSASRACVSGRCPAPTRSTGRLGSTARSASTRVQTAWLATWRRLQHWRGCGCQMRARFLLTWASYLDRSVPASS
mmetsp:Transcript_17935/g.46429  ORF Transcript_17935/g.46429 Transcript_17935/m.46429 type:complete len:201 (-) Transcript_17935:738-1340(-)